YCPTSRTFSGTTEMPEPGFPPSLISRRVPRAGRPCRPSMNHLVIQRLSSRRSAVEFAQVPTTALGSPRVRASKRVTRRSGVATPNSHGEQQISRSCIGRPTLSPHHPVTADAIHGPALDRCHLVHIGREGVAARW